MDNALAMGHPMASKFSDSLPDGFHAPIKKELVTMETLKKRVKVGDACVYDMEKLCTLACHISKQRYPFI